MALVACHECGKEISTEAKTCPHCGAKNKNREKSKAPWRLIIIAVLGLLCWFYFSPTPEEMIPACESADGRDRFKKLFDNGQYAQQNKLRVIDITDQKDLSTGPRPIDRICEATLRLNNGKKVVYTFSFELSPSGIVIINGKPK